MTEIYEDNVQIDMTIDGQKWLLIDAEVELSEATTPNYVILKMSPDPEETIDNLPDKIQDLVGTEFSLSADTGLISERDSSEDSLLFEGILGNISPTGENVYEGKAYDPSQASFAEVERATSLLNQSVYIPPPEYSLRELINIYLSGQQGTQHKTRTIKASELIERIVDKGNIPEYNIDLADDGIEISGAEGSYTGGYDRDLKFEDPYPKIENALEKATNMTQSMWWFDKTGTFNFGVPRPTKHELRFISDTSAGVSTPPYQSVIVIGSGIASEEGWSRASMNPENELVVEARTAKDGEGNNIIEMGETSEPVFTYRNSEVSTQAQAESTARQLVEKLQKQQEDGEVTVVGFPEIVPFDVIKMPNSDEQPMGGKTYAVYSVKHRLNNTDGFITKIKVAGTVGINKAIAKDDKEENTGSEYAAQLQDGDGVPSGAGFID